MASDDNNSQELSNSFPHGLQSTTDKLNEAYNNFASSTRELFEANNDEIIEQVINAIEIQDFRQRENYIRSAKIKKEVFVAGVSFLQKIFNARSPISEVDLKKKRIDEVRDLMLKMIIAASPSFCNNCTIVFSSASVSRLRCFSCDAGLCPNCVSQNDLEAAKAVLKNIAPICDECLWSSNNPDRLEETQEEIPLSIPSKVISQQEDINEIHEGMVEMEEEYEDDIPLIINPKEALKELEKEDTMFPEDNVFDEVNTTIITINAESEIITVSSTISPEKSKSPTPSLTISPEKPKTSTPSLKTFISYKSFSSFSN